MMRWRAATIVVGGVLLVPLSSAALDLDAVFVEVAKHDRARAAPLAGAGAARTQPPRAAEFEPYGEAWRSYVEVYFVQMLAREHEERLAALERILQAARSAYRAGRGGYFELLAAEAARTRALADRSAAVGERRRLRAQLDLMMGRTPGEHDDALLPPPMPDVPASAAAWLDVVSDEAAMVASAGQKVAEPDLRTQVLLTHAAALHAEQRTRLLADTVVVAHQRAFDAAWRAYTDGSASLAAVLDAAEMLYTERGSLLMARRDIAVAQARLVALTGRADLLGVRLPLAESVAR